MLRNVSLIMVMVLGVMAGGLLAGDKAVEKPAVKSEKVMLKGKLVCMGCDLKKAEGARAECGNYGHHHALKTADGKYIQFLENKFSADIGGEKYHNMDVEISGILFAKANLIDVESFTVDGVKQGWCKGHTAMDQCASK